MPSPVGHALGGLIVALAFPSRRGLAKQEGHEGPNNFRVLRGLRVHREMAAWCVVAACLPDIDFAWGRHNMETHSLGFACLVGLLVLAWKRSPRLAVACALAASTHVLFDWLGSDDFPPLGVMALWPVSHEFYFAHAYVFATISRRYWLPDFFSHNLLSVALEVLVLTPLVVVMRLLRTDRT